MSGPNAAHLGRRINLSILFDKLPKETYHPPF